MIKLSIITINYNNADGLRNTLASVAAQTYRDIEHIIVDAASKDGSVDIIKEYAEKADYPVQWISEKDKGVYAGMNKGIEIALGRRVVNALNRSELVEDKNIGIQRATGDYIQILNSGDLLAAPDVTERMVAALQDGTPILYGNMLKSYDGKTIINRDTCGSWMYTPESFLYFYKGTLNHDCAYIRWDLFEKYGLYNEEMKICSDWEWYVKAIALGGEKAVYTDINVTIFDMNGVSESHGKNAELIKKERREYLEKILPSTILYDYDTFSFPVLQYQRLKKYHLWGLAYYIERVLFKLEKWKLLK